MNTAPPFGLRRHLCLAMTIIACSGSGNSESAPPPPELAPVPEMVPDPAPVVPEVTVPAPERTREDSIRVLQLVARARAARDSEEKVSHSIALLREALAIDSVHSDALWELGWNYQLLRQWDTALATWHVLQQQQPTHDSAKRYVPIVQMRRDRAAQHARSGVFDVEERARQGEPITVGAVGDVQMGTSWPEEAPRLPSDSARNMFSFVAPMLRHPDVTFGNLETVLADSGASTKCRRGSQNCYAFRAPTVFARTLRDVGFDVLSANNNHASDFGDFGLRSTVRALEAAGLHSAGPVNGAASWETQGLRIALLAFSTGQGPYRVQDIEAARRAVLEADRNHDLVFVSFHGGAEGSGATRVPRQTEHAYGEDRGDVFRFSRAMVDAGADLILGHGPHVLRAMEIYRGRLIAYSLGNFAAWHGFNLRGPSGISVILEVTLAPNGVITDAALHPVALDPPGVPKPDPGRQGVAIVRELSQLDFGNPLFDTDGRLIAPPQPN